MGRLLVHHMNPIQKLDLLDFNPDVLNPEFLICVSNETHNAIHFGDERQLPLGLSSNDDRVTPIFGKEQHDVQEIAG